ncbi:MAG: spore coat protein [Bacillales bacterium]|jgi:hypothetical protein|nr:spore coat protein [Bacillales bacterium]
MSKIIDALRGRKRSNPYFQQYNPNNQFMNVSEHFNNEYQQYQQGNPQNNQNQYFVDPKVSSMHQYFYQNQHLSNNNLATNYEYHNQNNQQYNPINNGYQYQGMQQQVDHNYPNNNQQQQQQIQWNNNYWPNPNIINRPPSNMYPQNLYPKNSGQKTKANSSSGFLTHFKSSDGSLDINKMMNTAGTMVNTVNQISSMVKSFGAFFIK